MNFSFGPLALTLGALNLIVLIVGVHFLISEFKKNRRNGGFSAGMLEPWRAGRKEILVFAGIFFVVVLLVPTLVFRAAGALFPEIDLVKDPVYIVGFYQPVALAFLLGVCFSGKKTTSRFLCIADTWNAASAKPLISRISPCSRSNVWQFFALMMLAVTLAGLLSQCVPLVFPSLKDAWAQNQILVDNLRTLENPWILFILVPTLTVFTPILEEILFRAGIYRLLRNKMSAVPAALLTGFCFAIMHDSFAGILPLTVLSCVLCYAYERTGRLAVPIIMHGLFNLNTLLLIFAE